jgi:hypothetical protein
MNLLRNVAFLLLAVVLIAGGWFYWSVEEAGRDQTGVELDAPLAQAPINPVLDDWRAEQAARRDAKAAYIKTHQEAYDWFTLFPFSKSDGIPLLILKVLPALAPEVWGEGEDFLSLIGLFHDTRVSSPILPTGVGFTGLTREDPTATIDYTSFTCAACHIGRVRGEDGQLHYIDGGINSEFNINLYFVKLSQTLALVHGAEQDPALRLALITDRVVQAVDAAAATSPHYFYAEHRYGGRSFDAAYEAAQIALFKQDAARHVKAFVDYTEGFVAAFSHYLDKTYDGYQEQMLAGLPGMADATGVSAAHGYENMAGGAVDTLLAELVLPSSPGLTDFMAVWEQDSRTAEWDSSGQQLINGGGQYNGNIPVPMFRNLAASMTMGLADTDIRVAAFSAELLGSLPATVWPFAVDSALAQRGAELFERHCEACHQPNNGRVYDELGTSMARAGVINTLLMEGARAEYTSVCSPQTTVTMYGREVQPCAEFKGVPLDNMDHVVMRPLEDQRGYNALPLKGIWALAPYLHNGSVPTLHHLLLPSERPQSFVKSRLEYDQEKVGFSWQDDGTPGGYRFDTSVFHAINNKGHDRDVTLDGVTYKLAWEDDRDGAAALLEYMKTL